MRFFFKGTKKKEKGREKAPIVKSVNLQFLIFFIDKNNFKETKFDDRNFKRIQTFKRIMMQSFLCYKI